LYSCQNYDKIIWTLTCSIFKGDDWLGNN
jgi:hypothetical protein